MFRRVFNRVSPCIHNIRTISSDIQIIEVGLRDGLQSHKTFIPTDNKKKLIDKLVLAGISDIEATAFVSQKAVPQMSDCNEIMNYCNKTYGADNITFSALVPNMHFFEKSLYSYSKKVAIFTTVSETFCEKNIRCSISKSLENCFVKEFLGSVNILINASSSNCSRVVITGSLPMNSGIKPNLIKSSGLT